MNAVCREIETIGANCKIAVCDLSQPEQIDALIRTYCGFGAHLDILVNSAGMGFHGFIEDMPDDQWQTLIAVNLLAPIHLVRRFLPIMTARPEAHIVNIASIAGLVAGRKMAAYQTSKFGLVGFTMALRAGIQQSRAWSDRNLSRNCSHADGRPAYSRKVQEVETL